MRGFHLASPWIKPMLEVFIAVFIVEIIALWFYFSRRRL